VLSYPAKKQKDRQTNGYENSSAARSVNGKDGGAGVGVSVKTQKHLEDGVNGMPLMLLLQPPLPISDSDPSAPSLD